MKEELGFGAEPPAARIPELIHPAADKEARPTASNERDGKHP
jgi:hypothetical protein